MPIAKTVSVHQTVFRDPVTGHFAPRPASTRIQNAKKITEKSVDDGGCSTETVGSNDDVPL